MQPAPFSPWTWRDPAIPGGYATTGDPTVDTGGAGFGPLLSTMGDETRAEVLWCALHGMADLSRHGRLGPDHQTARVEMLAGLLGGGRHHE